MSNQTIDETNHNSLEDKLAAIAAAMQGKQATADTGTGFVCPIDPQERAMCDACQ